MWERIKMAVGVPNGSTHATSRPCIVVAFWFEDGITVEEASYLLDTCSKLPAYYVCILEPSWLIAVYPDDSAMRRSVSGVLAALSTTPKAHELNRGLHIGIELGDLIVSVDHDGRSLTHPIGLPMSRAMKKASDSPYNTPVGLEDLNF